MSRAIIVGAGVAGTVAALALQKAGWEPVVYEAYDFSAGLDQGVFLTLAVNGLDALAAVDASAVVKQLGFPTGKIAFANGSGRSLGAMDIGPRLADGTTTRSLRRSELYATLHDLTVGRGIAIAHGKRLVRADSHPDGVTVTFADGTTDHGDVLIGADGLRSTVRALIDPHAPEPRYTGMGNVGGFTRTDGVGADGGDYRMIWGKRCFFGYTVSPDDEVWWFANPPRPKPLTDRELRERDPQDAKRDLVQLFDGDKGPAASIVASTTGPILIGNQYDMPRVTNWNSERMIVIGDAAHAVSPSTGQGVALACEDAVVLAQCLRDAPDVASALTLYETLRRDRVEKVVAWGSKMGGTKTTGPVMRILRDLTLPYILAKGAKPEAMAKQSWLFDHHIDWDVPTTTAAAARDV